MTHARTIVLAVLGSLGTPPRPADGPVIITFDKVETGKPMPSYTDQGVVFALSRPPTTSRAAGRVMFFPHLKTPQKGILNAMANESIPVGCLVTTADDPVTITFDKVETGKPLSSYTDQGVVFALSRPPSTSLRSPGG